MKYVKRMLCASCGQVRNARVPTVLKTARHLAFCTLFAAVSYVHAQTEDVLRIVNRLRAPEGACAASARPFVSTGALDVAAAGMARGASLDSALESAGYRVTEAQVITVKGEGFHAQLEALLPRQYCAQIGNPQLTHAGVYERGNQLWIVLAAPFAPKVDLSRQQVAERTLALVNAARAIPRRCGDKAFAAARPVSWNDLLEQAAARHAADMAAYSYFSHTGRDGATPAQRVARSGYRYRTMGENIAGGQLSPDETVADWIKSPGHCANLMNGAFAEMGVAFSVNPKSKLGVYWAQDFGGK